MVVVQLEPVYPPGRKIRVNTVAFDVECVLLLSEEDVLGDDMYFAVVNGLAFRKADLLKYMLPHQEVNLTFATAPEKFGYLTVVPYGVSYNITQDTEIDPNLTDEIDNDPGGVSPNDEITRKILHYKHHTRCLPLSETCFTIPQGVSIAAGMPPNLPFFTAPTTSSYAWPWFSLTNTPEELIVIPVPDLLVPYVTHYPPVPPDPVAVPGAILSLELKCNLGHVVPDCAVRNCIYSTYQVIRGNEYGTRESIIDYLPVQ